MAFMLEIKSDKEPKFVSPYVNRVGDMVQIIFETEATGTYDTRRVIVKGYAPASDMLKFAADIINSVSKAEPGS